MGSKPYPNCAGIVVIDQKRENTILVQTDRGYYSFPKGKRKKPETDLEAAYRELQEETGITENQIVLRRNEDGELKYMDEYTDKGVASIRYFIGDLNCDVKKFSYDHDELENVDWYPFDKIKNLEKLKCARKQVFSELNG